MKGKKVWIRGMWMELWEWKQIIHISRCHINGYSKNWHRENFLKKQVVRMTHAVDIKQLLSSVILVLAQYIYEMSWCYVLNQAWSWFSLTKGDQAIVTAECVTLQEQHLILILPSRISSSYIILYWMHCTHSMWGGSYSSNKKKYQF